jgi:hypothetical protein
MIYPLVTDLAADGVPVAVTCRVLGFSKQGYYRWKASPVTERDWIDAHLVNAARDIHAEDPTFGYGSSPTSSRRRASRRVRTGSSACAGSTASGGSSLRSGV